MDYATQANWTMFDNCQLIYLKFTETGPVNVIVTILSCYELTELTHLYTLKT